MATGAPPRTPVARQKPAKSHALILGQLLCEASDEGLLAILDAIEKETCQAVAETREITDLLAQVASEIYRRQRQGDLTRPRPTKREGLEPAEPAADEFSKERLTRLARYTAQAHNPHQAAAAASLDKAEHLLSQAAGQCVQMAKDSASEQVGAAMAEALAREEADRRSRAAQEDDPWRDEGSGD
jgi:hypothetical protein